MAHHCAAGGRLEFASVVNTTWSFVVWSLSLSSLSHFASPNYPKINSMELEYLHPHGVSLTKVAAAGVVKYSRSLEPERDDGWRGEVDKVAILKQINNKKKQP